MSDKKTQKIPKSYEIPIPTRGEFFANPKKTAKPPNAQLPPPPEEGPRRVRRS